MSDRNVLSASASDAGLRLDAFLSSRHVYKSRNAAVRAIEDSRVLVNGCLARKNHRMSEGDVVLCEQYERDIPGLLAAPIDLDIRYEDDDIIVISKQAGLVSHPSSGHQNDTLVNALVARYGIENLCKVQGNDENRCGIVHRLDRDTSGLMLAAKSDLAGMRLMNQIADRHVDRHYLALVHGILQCDNGKIDAPIARHSSDRKKRAVSDSSSAREAITTFNVLERFSCGPHDDGYSLIDCKLFTGRTHQIRVHMEYIRHPVVGDPMYSAHAPKITEAQCGLDRQFLHSYRLAFQHPTTDKNLDVYDCLPSDLERVLFHLEPRSLGCTDYGRDVFDSLSLLRRAQIDADDVSH